MSERTREKRFDDVFQMVLIIVALSFDILWAIDHLPIAEIAVFVFVLMIWAYGTLKGGIWEYPLKLGSFNLAIILLTNFYSVAVLGDMVSFELWQLAITVLILPIICVTITFSLAMYLKESIDRGITLGVIIGGTIGYIVSMILVFVLGIPIS